MSQHIGSTHTRLASQLHTQTHTLNQTPIYKLHTIKLSFRHRAVRKEKSDTERRERLVRE
jgi:hypothetical protein